MKKNEVLEFLKRGFAFAGLGCVLVGFILWMVSLNVKDFHMEGWQIFLAIISGYLIAFVHAGTSLFRQIERWAPLKATGLQLLCLYVIYLAAYLANNWIPLNWLPIVIFSGAFIVGYFIIWLIVYSIVRANMKKLNKQLK